MSDAELIIAVGKSRTETIWRNDYLTWNEFVMRLKRVRRTEETMEQYAAMTDAQKGKIKDGPAFVGGAVRGGRRKRDSIDSRCLFTLDVDHADEGFISIAQIIILGGVAHVIYSTHSHRPNKPKYRLIVLASREMTPDEYAAAARMLAFIIGMDYFDRTTFDVNRLMYMPSCSKNADPLFVDGSQAAPIDVDWLLSQYEDWQDMGQWKKHPNEAVDVAKARGKLKDAREKNDLIGQFCRSYSIEEAIAKFIPDVYLPVPGYDDRWTYSGGSSAGGMLTYSDGHMYSMHQSDPANTGHCLNAYDLIRIHKFGSLDEGVSDKTNFSKYPSQVAMRELAATDPLVRELAIEETFGESMGNAEIEDDLSGSDEGDMGSKWMLQLETDHRNPNKILPTAENVEIILKNGPFQGVLAYDEFLNTEVIRRRLPWRERKRVGVDYEPWLGADDSRLQHYFGKVYKINSKAIISNAFKEVTHQNEFHPVKEYLISQKWDGNERLESLFIQYLGTEDTEYVRAVTRKMFVAAVARVFNPGCKFDYMLVLVGPQGAGKSTILAKMGRQWFSDSLKSFDTKEAGEHLQSAWIFEFGELAGMSKTEVDEIKQFITKTSDKYRVAYDRVITDFPRKCIFFGTTNNYNFLKDDTGNRRFWPIDVDPSKRTKNVFTDLTEYEIGQIWAEALHVQQQGESLKLSDALEKMAGAVQGDHTEDDPRLGLIAEYLEKPLPENWLGMDEYERRGYLEMPTGHAQRKLVCASEIWVECLGKRLGDMRTWEAREIYSLLRKIPGWRERKTRAYFQKYGKQTTFERTV
ncbi:virulence-associated E family protein [Paenibacillus oryzisoli]|uniref:VapE domain-containing protein n=1 Tax=Paenibacillus oryzisoli TaxID=1850517 RepID=UPI003D26E10F